MILQYYCILVVLIVHRHKRPSSYFQNEGNCTLSVWPMWKSNWNPSMCNTKICIQIFNSLQSTWTICFAPSFFCNTCAIRACMGIRDAQKLKKEICISFFNFVEVFALILIKILFYVWTLLVTHLIILVLGTYLRRTWNPRGWKIWW